MKSLLARIVVAGMAVLALGSFAGCAAKTAKPDLVTTDYGPDEYITAPPETGSHIPRKIKVKDALSERGSTKSKVEDVDPDEFRRGMRQMPKKPDGS